MHLRHAIVNYELIKWNFIFHSKLSCNDRGVEGPNLLWSAKYQGLDAVLKLRNMLLFVGHFVNIS